MRLWMDLKHSENNFCCLEKKRKQIFCIANKDKLWVQTRAMPYMSSYLRNPMQKMCKGVARP